MSDFKIIETQEQLNEIIAERLNRAKEAAAKQYTGYMSPDEVAQQTSELSSKINTLQTQLNDSLEAEKSLKASIEAKETELNKAKLAVTREATIRKYNLSHEAAEFLTGTNTDELEANAEKLKKLSGVHNGMPLASTEKEITKDGARHESLKAMLNEMKGN